MKKKEFFLISLTLFVLVIVWMIADIYHELNKKKLEFVNLPEIKDYKLDEKVFQILSDKKP